MGADAPKPPSVYMDPGMDTPEGKGKGMDASEPEGKGMPHPPDGPVNPVPLGKGGSDSEMPEGKSDGRENDPVGKPPLTLGAGISVPGRVGVGVGGTDESPRPRTLAGLALTGMYGSVRHEKGKVDYRIP